MKKELIQKIYEDACAKGFHTEYKSDQHWLIMVITEVAEAIEADRQNRYVKLNPTIKAVFNDVTKSDEAFIDRFQQYIKNHVEDELADIVTACAITLEIRASLIFQILPSRQIRCSLPLSPSLRLLMISLNT